MAKKKKSLNQLSIKTRSKKKKKECIDNDFAIFNRPPFPPAVFYSIQIYKKKTFKSKSEKWNEMKNKRK